MSAAEQMAEALRLRDPIKYENAQATGELTMTLGFDFAPGEDAEGDAIRYRELARLLEQGIVEPHELTGYEQRLVAKFSSSSSRDTNETLHHETKDGNEPADKAGRRDEPKSD